MNLRGPYGKHQDQRSKPCRGVYFASWAPPRCARNGAKHVCRDFRRADHRVVRGARPDPEGGGTTVNYANAIGLVLCLVIALFLVAALLFPERF